MCWYLGKYVNKNLREGWLITNYKYVSKIPAGKTSIVNPDFKKVSIHICYKFLFRIQTKRLTKSVHSAHNQILAVWQSEFCNNYDSEYKSSVVLGTWMD